MTPYNLHIFDNCISSWNIMYACVNYLCKFHTQTCMCVHIYIYIPVHMRMCMHITNTKQNWQLDHSRITFPRRSELSDLNASESGFSGWLQLHTHKKQNCKQRLHTHWHTFPSLSSNTSAPLSLGERVFLCVCSLEFYVVLLPSHTDTGYVIFFLSEAQLTMHKANVYIKSTIAYLVRRNVSIVSKIEYSKPACPKYS